MTGELEQQFALPNADAIRGLWQPPGSTIHSENLSRLPPRSVQSLPGRQLAVDEPQLPQALSANLRTSNNSFECTASPLMPPKGQERRRAITARGQRDADVPLTLNIIPESPSLAQLLGRDLDCAPRTQLAQNYVQQNGLCARQGRRVDRWFSSGQTAVQDDPSAEGSGWPPNSSSKSSNSADYDSRIVDFGPIPEAIRRLLMIAERAFGTYTLQR